MPMMPFKTFFRAVFPVLACLFLNVSATHAQNLTVENVRTDNFPELRFDVRTDEDLIANKGRLVVKDNYVPVASYKLAPAKASAAGKGFVISYTVPDPERLDGTATFEYKGKAITTTYLVKKPTAEQEAAYPKIERTSNTLFYVIGGLGLAAGIVGFLLSRRKNRRVAEPETPQYIPTPPQPAATPVPQPAPVPPASAAAVSAISPLPQASADDAYKPKPQGTPVPPPSAETMVSPGLMPTITIRINERPTVLSPNGTLQKIGRSPECDLVIPHPTVSKIHASIHLQNGTWWMEDLGSTNGTYADGQRITKAALRNGSKLYFGQVTGVFNLPQ